ncbi:CrcB family protein [Corynebacterium sp. MSK044]|uniref:FluC/FEX family fluoride channel n=1 Tax=Corynebacterium sp. MSK044 TaxID=3050195 RepID=UPI00254F35B9|nr:CrcB family protein [Corynebacterium sp. MSK044]MDK8798330.1 CrcB family protein [Corynebacterium sp. MSK044]
MTPRTPQFLGPDGVVGSHLREALSTGDGARTIFLLFVFVGFGAFLGGLTRWALSVVLKGTPGTWAANLIGSAVLGFSAAMPSMWPAFLGAGFGGAVSTLSTMAKEMGQMVERKQWWPLLRYTTLTCVAGVIAAWYGLRVGLQLIPAF